MDGMDKNNFETSADIKGFNLNASNSSKAADEGHAGQRFDPDSWYYDMSGEKHLIILNQYKFQNTVYFNDQQPTTRTGTEKDVQSLISLFSQGLGFKFAAHHDLEYEGVFNELTEFATRDHSKTSCICIAILTHGDKDGELYAADRPYLLSDVTTIFAKQPSLAGKPKLFFIQACRGSGIDAGNTIQPDSVDGHSHHRAVVTIPTHADVLVLRSTVEDHLSFRDVNGSWMIQDLCDIISKYHENLDLLQMIVLMNRKVAYERSTYTPKNKNMHKKKQMPETKLTLTRQLKF